MHKVRGINRYGLGIWLMAVFSSDVLGGAGTPLRGVSIWLPKAPLQGGVDSMKTEEWQPVVVQEPPCPLRGDPVIATDTLLAAFDSQEGFLNIYTRKGDRLKRCGVVFSLPTRRPVEFNVVRGAPSAGIGVEVYSSSSTESGEGHLECVVYLSADGIIEFKPGGSTALTVNKVSTRYGIIPSFIGADLVLDPNSHSDKDQLYVPSMNLYVGLMEGNDCMMVGVWPPGDQVVKLGLKAAGDERILDSFTIEMAKRSFYLTYLECPNIWHAEPLKETYLERKTAIRWKRPFDAMWIGRFFVESNDIDFPFYFQDRKMKMWGRFVRDWYEYPVWFDGDKTFVHFEKKFPPTGEMLIYFLEGRGHKVKKRQTVLSPVEVMQKSLGTDQANNLLDFEGVNARPLLEHGHAVCAMSELLEKIFAGSKEVKERARVQRLADDIATFIRLIRGRVMEFDAFASQTRDFLDAQSKADTQLAGGFEQVRARLDEIQNRVKNGLPPVSLDEVRGWTEQIKGLAAEVRKGNKEKLVTLTFQCRNVAGTQDDLVRDLSVVVIGVMEAAAEAGVTSAKRAKLAQQIIARCRRQLRHGTVLEPTRVHTLASTPD